MPEDLSILVSSMGLRGVAALGPEGSFGASGLGDSLPCLNSDNSNGLLGSAHKKRDYSVQWNVQALILKAGLQNVGFLTLTFKGGVPCMKEAQRRFNCFSTGVLREMFGAWIVVVERHRRGGVHYHLLVDCKADIRTGFDFEAVKRRNYKSASPAIRSMWSKLRAAAIRYGFGERATELLPIRVSGHAVACYLTKYLTKHICHRRPEDKRKRLVRYSRGANACRQQISWVTKGASLYRHKLRECAQVVGGTAADWKLKEAFGPSWAHLLKPILTKLNVQSEGGSMHITDEDRRALYVSLQDLKTRLTAKKDRHREGALGTLRISGQTSQVDRAAEAGVSTFQRDWRSEPQKGQRFVLTGRNGVRVEAFIEGHVEAVWASGDGYAVKVRWTYGTNLVAQWTGSGRACVTEPAEGQASGAVPVSSKAESSAGQGEGGGTSGAQPQGSHPWFRDDSWDMQRRRPVGGARLCLPKSKPRSYLLAGGHSGN